MPDPTPIRFTEPSTEELLTVTDDELELASQLMCKINDVYRKHVTATQKGEDASIESGEVVDVRLLAVRGMSYEDALARLKGRCFVLAEAADAELSAALRALGSPNVESVKLPTHDFRGKLTGPMTKRLLPWFVVGAVLTFAGVRSMCHTSNAGERPRSPAAPTIAVKLPSSTTQTEALPAPQPAPIIVNTSARNLCEPLEWPLCAKRGELCSPMPDGTKRRCRQRTRRHGAVELVCVPEVPSREIQSWRRARLRTIVESICDPRKGCRPNDLMNYLTILADRETSRRPWKRHRMDVDRESASQAWTNNKHRYADSPAVDEPWRWATGLGYYGQNPALWLWRWDEQAEPETLCGEVESTLVHLRGARQRWRLLTAGVACDGEEFHGSSEGGAPSWYDISLVNSGSEACPAQPGDGRRWRQRRSFERRAERFGLDPYAPVSLKMLGTPVAQGKQAEFVAKVYAQVTKVQR